MGNTFGKIFKLTTFGESHGKAIGGIIDGCPANMNLVETDIQKQLNRRRPGQSHITTPRNESDTLELLSNTLIRPSCSTTNKRLVPSLA